MGMRRLISKDRLAVDYGSRNNWPHSVRIWRVGMSVTANRSDREAAVVERVPRGLFVGGSWRPATGGGTFAVEDPSTGEVIAEVADATVEDGRAALDAAVAAQPAWAATPPR